MLNQSDQPSVSNAMPPPPETNPLSNPLLRDNLRRWAEVYFGNPPEHREQAIQELLRHLEAETGPNQAGTDTSTTVEESDSGLVRCKVCGHNNARFQRFCGMCGSEALPLDQGTNTQLERVSDETWNLDKTPEDAEQEAGNWRSESDSAAFTQSVPNSNELSLFQDVPRREPDYDDPDFQYESSSSQPFRFFIGLVLAVMLGGLGYMAWRATEASRPHQVSPPPPAIVPEEATAPAEPRQPSPEPAAPPPVKNPAETPTARNSAVAGTSETGAASPKVPVKAATTHRATAHKPARAARAQASSDKGTEELSIAVRYLSGAHGKRRDTAEASKWLWRSVSKHNEQATVLLADLYLRGDGVSKNCDQARMLLDSAARKGSPAAGERLRNLRAFGCR